MENTESRILAFIGEHFQAPENLRVEESLLDGGIIDSMGVLTIVIWLEDEFGLVVDDEDVVPENIDSVANLVRYVNTKLDESSKVG